MGASAGVDNETHSSQYEAERDWARSVHVAEGGCWWRVEAVEMRAAVMERWLQEREDEMYNEARKVEEGVVVPSRRCTSSVQLDHPGVLSSARDAAPTTSSCKAAEKRTEEAQDETVGLDEFFAKKDRKNKRQNRKKQKASSRTS
jgi:hypothetical protein